MADEMDDVIVSEFEGYVPSPKIVRSPPVTEDDITEYFSSMDACVVLINETIADATRALEIHDDEAGVKAMIKRNTDHLEIQVEKQWYKDSSKTKTSYTKAITDGKAYVAG
jgi:hypothetical protein|tara:strand:- start:24 stop:356 length:333 start_codon:yes stop_codon:yes gene_type:complete